MTKSILLAFICTILSLNSYSSEPVKPIKKRIPVPSSDVRWPGRFYSPNPGTIHCYLQYKVWCCRVIVLGCDVDDGCSPQTNLYVYDDSGAETCYSINSITTTSQTDDETDFTVDPPIDFNN